MRGALFSVAAAVSLLLAVGVVILWARTATKVERLSREGTRYSFASNWNGLELSDVVERGAKSAPHAQWEYQVFDRSGYQRAYNDEADLIDYEERDFGVRFAGLWFVYFGEDKTAATEWSISAGWRLTVPHWMAMLAALVLPAWWVWRRWNPRVRPGDCVQCGYDLRASAGKCPECGTAIEVGRVSAVGGEK